MRFLLLSRNERWTWTLTDDEGQIICVSAGDHADREAAISDLEQIRILAPTAAVVMQQLLADEAPCEEAHAPQPTVAGFAPPLHALLGRLGPLFDRHYLIARAQRSVREAREVTDAHVQLLAEAGAMRAHSARVRQHSAAARSQARPTAPPPGPGAAS